MRTFRRLSVMLGGLAVAAVGFGLLTRVGGASGLTVLVTGTFLYSLGISPVFTLANDMILASAPPERAGSASSISETSSELGGALGIAILGSIGTAIYRSRVAEEAPVGIPTDAPEAARKTLGGAVAVAERLPEQLGAALLAPAREAFTHAMRLNAAISVAVVVAMAVAAALLLRA